MGRPSKLSEQQWNELGKRLLAGEKAADLAREFKVSCAVISRRFAKSNATVKSVANQLVSAEQKLRELPVSQQLAALTLADELRAISMHLAGAAKYSAASAHRLAGIAHGKVQQIDDAMPLDGESLESLKGVAVLQKMANDAAIIPGNLLAANKDSMKTLQPHTPPPSRVMVEVVDASMPDAPA